MTTPVRLSVGNVHWSLEYFHLDFQGILIVNVNFGSERTVIQTHAYRQQQQQQQHEVGARRSSRRIGDGAAKKNV